MRKYEVNPGLLRANANLFNVNGRRKYGDFLGITGYAADGVSVYHGLRATVTRRFESHFKLNGSYVFSKTLDNATGSLGQDVADRYASPWGRASSDRWHNFVVYGVWELPGFRALRVFERILSGWQVAGSDQIRSGLPFGLRNQFDSTLQGIEPGFPDIIAPFAKQNPRKIQTFRLPSGATATGNFFFDHSVFRTVRPANLSEARNACRFTRFHMRVKGKLLRTE